MKNIKINKGLVIKVAAATIATAVAGVLGFKVLNKGKESESEEMTMVESELVQD